MEDGDGKFVNMLVPAYNTIYIFTNKKPFHLYTYQAFEPFQCQSQKQVQFKFHWEFLNSDWN